MDTKETAKLPKRIFDYPQLDPQKGMDYCGIRDVRLLLQDGIIYHNIRLETVGDDLVRLIRNGDHREVRRLRQEGRRGSSGSPAYHPR